MSVETKDKIYMRGEIMSKKECDWLRHDIGDARVTFLMATIMVGFVAPLGLIGTGFLIFKGEWWFPWDVGFAWPLLLIPCLAWGLWYATTQFWRPWKVGYAKRRKLETGNYTQQDVDEWTMAKKGKRYRTSDGQMPKIMYDMTLDSFMNDAELPRPK